MDHFPYEYVGGGYFRLKGVKKGESAETLHGEQVVDLFRKLLAEKDAEIASLEANMKASYEDRRS